ncbi:MAG: VC0807 family protein [Candidatus Omnitrophota bacterium]|nr:VC0807 family protein [Candidatus Omnitrophota bacterium]
MIDEKPQSTWQVFRHNFPWKDVIVGFLIPKVIFLYGLNQKMPFLWGGIAVAWCVVVFLIGQARTHKTNIFAILALVLILVRIVVVIAQRDPRTYLFLVALDEFIFGVIFLVSLFFSRSIIEIFADVVGVRAPEKIIRSKYYSKAWRIVTAVWGVTYLLFALLLVLLNVNDLKIVGKIDMFAWLPVLVVLFIFTIVFPQWYWKNNYTNL